MITLNDSVFDVTLQHAEAAKVVLKHGGLDEVAVVDETFELRRIVNRFWCARRSLTCGVGCFSVLLCCGKFVVEDAFDLGIAVLAMERLAAVGLDVLCVQQALQYAVCEAGVPQILKSGKLQKDFLTLRRGRLLCILFHFFRFTRIFNVF